MEVNGSVKEQSKQVSRIVRRHQERFQQEVVDTYERLRKSFFDNVILGSGELDEQTVNDTIRQYNAKWVTYCKIKNVNAKAHSALKESLEDIYRMYKESLNA